MWYLLDRLLLFLVIICSVLSVVLTLYDKRAAKKRPKKRVRERTLLLLALFGGALFELLTMLCIRHKTKHKKFMLGLPLILLLQLGLCVFFVLRLM